MPTYIALMNFTTQGVQKYRDTRKRAATFTSMAGKVGVKVREVYWSLGQYDGVLILEADDDEAVTAAMLQLGALGNVRTQTMRAFAGDEMDDILSRAPRGKG